jgi:hypothetical protein
MRRVKPGNATRLTGNIAAEPQARPLNDALGGG